MPTLYPIDYTGEATTNLVENETITLVQTAPSGQLFVVPRYAPFFSTGLVVKHIDPFGAETTLTQGIEFNLGLKYFGASRACASPIYGAICLTNRALVGSIKIEAYQTLGGAFTLSTSEITQILASLSTNPKVTSWEQVANIPSSLPPAPHPWDPQNDEGASDVVRAISQVAAIAAIKKNVDKTAALQLFGANQTVTAGVVNSRVMVFSPCFLTQVCASVHTPSVSADIWVWVRVNGSTVTNGPLVVPQGQNYAVMDVTDFIKTNRFDAPISITAEVASGHAGSGATQLTAYVNYSNA